MDSDNIIREEGAEGAVPEEVMEGGYKPLEEPAAPQGAGRIRTDAGCPGKRPQSSRKQRASV